MPNREDNPSPDRDRDRLSLTLAQRIATGAVGLVLMLMGLGGMLTSRLSGSTPGSVPFVAIGVAAFGAVLLVVAVRGRTFTWLPARSPGLLPQMVLAVGVVTIAAIGHGVQVVRGDATGRAIGLGSMALAVMLVVVAVVRRWVPRFGDHK